MKRFRVLTAVLCAAVLLCGFSVPAYAYAGGRRTVRRPVQRKPTAASNGNICGKSGVHPLTIRACKIRL